MDSAAARFFAVPELTDALGPRLTKPSISALTKTSRQLYQLFQPWLYRELTLSYSDPNGRLLSCPDSIHALVRNIHYVRWLMCDQEEIAYLFNCLRINDLEGSYNNVGTVSTDVAALNGVDSLLLSILSTVTMETVSLSQQNWIPKLDKLTTANPDTFSFPPMKHLAYLELNLMPLASRYWPKYRLASSSFYQTTLRQVCWIIQQCSLLTGLELVHVPVMNYSQDMRLLIGTIVGMKKLKWLHLFVRAKESVCHRGYKELYFAISDTIERLKLFSSEEMHPAYYRDIMDQEDQQAEDGNEIEQEDHSGAFPPLIPRQERLLNMEKLVTWGMEQMSLQEVQEVFEQCPNIQILKIPAVSETILEQELHTNLAQVISEQCPRLRKLTCTGDSNIALFLETMKAIPSYRLEKVEITNIDCTSLAPAITRRAFSHHAQSLRAIDLRYSYGLCSKIFIALLEVCQVLEVFKKHSNPVHGDEFMTLEDAVSAPWACSKSLRHLELTIGIPTLSFGPFPIEDILIITSSEEMMLVSQLQELYDRLSTCLNLGYLDMRRVDYDHTAYSDHRNLSMFQNNQVAGDANVVTYNYFPPIFTAGRGSSELKEYLPKCQLRGSVRRD
ncbi:hypothetical protein FBU30_010639 [Linnemannia zychae]|nr:hypothetical protein FBU30_010639 [Linnemannia zychae]